MKYDETILNAMVKFEGFSFTEAKLSYKRREKLPSGAFCGPNRTYPVPDAAHVRNALARLSQFGRRLKPAVRATILACIKRRAKRFGVEISETVEGKLCLVKFDETLDEKTRKKWQIEIDETVAWFSEVNQDVKYKIVKDKAGKFAVMVTTGKKFPPWKVVKTFNSEPEAKAFIEKQNKE